MRVFFNKRKFITFSIFLGVGSKIHSSEWKNYSSGETQYFNQPINKCLI